CTCRRGTILLPPRVPRQMVAYSTPTYPSCLRPLETAHHPLHYNEHASHTMRRALFSFCLCLWLFTFATAASQAPAVTDDCPYCQLYGQRFRTEVDLYLFQDTAEPRLRYFGLSNRS